MTIEIILLIALLVVIVLGFHVLESENEELGERVFENEYKIKALEKDIKSLKYRLEDDGR